MKVMTFVHKEYFAFASQPPNEYNGFRVIYHFSVFLTSSYFYVAYIPLLNYILLRVIGKYALTGILYPY